MFFHNKNRKTYNFTVSYEDIFADRGDILFSEMTKFFQQLSVTMAYESSLNPPIKLNC